MMKEELVSIIVPIYNVESYLDRCIDSLVKQTYRNLEIILVDDGSTDNSGKLADIWRKKDERITVFHKENGGLSDARNYGIDRAHGQLLSFVDSDDYVDETFIHVLYGTLTGANTKMAVVGYQCFQDEKTINHNLTQDRNIQLLGKQEALLRLYDREFGDYAWNKLYRKELFSNVRYPFGKKVEDMGTTYLLIDQCKQVALCPASLYFYFQRPDSISHRGGVQMKRDRYEMLYQRHLYIRDRYPELSIFQSDYFNKIFEAFPVISDEARAQALIEASEIWKRIGPGAPLKTRLKYVAIQSIPSLYKWYKKLRCHMSGE